jgi:hypothetical protein
MEKTYGYGSPDVKPTRALDELASGVRATVDISFQIV